MAISTHITHFDGLPLEDFAGSLEPEQKAYAVRVEYDGEGFAPQFERLLATPGVEKLRALVIGCWSDAMYDDDATTVTAPLIAAREKLSGLRSLFLGEMTYEENEISWIKQTDLSPLLAAYPQLEWLTVRGGESLEFSNLRHERLRGLTIETGGLGAEVIGQVLQGQLPALEHLELWPGSDSYGGDAAIEDLAPLFTGSLFPKLRHLGLCNAEFSNDIVAALASSPLLDRLEELDLSRGTLTDEGAAVLLREHRFRRLKKLNLKENFLTEASLREIGAILPNAEISEQREPYSEGEYYCSVSE